jgi:hypothetical protein
VIVEKIVMADSKGIDGTRSFIAVFTVSCHMTPPRARWSSSSIIGGKILYLAKQLSAFKEILVHILCVGALELRNADT